SGEGKEGTVTSQLPRAGVSIKKNSLVNLEVLRIQSSPHAMVDQILMCMAWGNIAFETPVSMKLKETSTIELLLSLSEPIDELKLQLKAKIDTYGEKIEILGSSIRVSNRMEARLTGSAFQITAITPELQAVGAKEVIQWKWEVKAIQAGLQTLHLTLTAILRIDDNDTPRAIRTFDKKIEVKVTVKQWLKKFVSDNWKWLWTVILVPIAYRLSKLWKRRREQKRKSRASRTSN
ncbi:MAG: hypothetical protein ACFFDT_29635, partial [Candidatus Hodarchaeota archaeon]